MTNEKLQISRVIPAHTMTLTARWCKKDFCKMSPKYRSIRESMSDTDHNCHWCDHVFDDGEMMALASFHKDGNKTLCQSCATELLRKPTDA